MCGLTGFIGAPKPADDLRAAVRAMSDAIVHRGPDDSGDFIDEANGLALGFRRLAIVDLSAAGHQPMTSSSGRYVIVFNGEVYNYESIRRELLSEGVAPEFRGHSDTEVMLAAIEAWGLESAVKRFVGMFAFALWDTRERLLHLVRDRMGVKPMYYGFSRGTFFFGSELKSLRRHPDFVADVDRDAVAAYLRFLYVPAPLSIYRGICKQTPGTIVTLSRTTSELRTTTYWSAAEVAERGVHQRFRGNESEAADELDALLRDAVAMRMVADVPLGVFLSGGIDSTLVTALMQAQASQPVKTFTIGFAEGAYDEAKYAAATARHLGTAHTELYVTPREAMDVIPRLPSMYDEPFADSSQIPTYLVSHMARQYVTVSLSGEGGDEVFGGYRRYFEGQRVLRAFGRVPAPLRRAIGNGIAAVPPRQWDRLLSWRQPQSGTQMTKLARVLRAPSLDDFYWDVVTYWQNVVSGAAGFSPPATSLTDPVERMMLLDQLTYLPGDILAKVDRASMAASLEAREPLLDHRVVELAWSLPPEMKVRGGTGKKILRDVLDRYVPRELIDRPKMGFKVPIDTWLRGPLRGWAEDLLDEKRLREQGLLDVAQVRGVWNGFVNGRSAQQDHVWAVLMLEAWMQ
ncbi:MAG TPA: asparagine synthase (glutamine-hydrolyzing) [Thermoanaerobaculia bacterium]|nr:asparagine synthase (glutamine-hydrolyzing) [Thermoanaerobaculia bacterium]